MNVIKVVVSIILIYTLILFIAYGLISNNFGLTSLFKNQINEDEENNKSKKNFNYLDKLNRNSSVEKPKIENFIIRGNRDKFSFDLLNDIDLNTRSVYSAYNLKKSYSLHDFSDKSDQNQRKLNTGIFRQDFVENIDRPENAIFTICHISDIHASVEKEYELDPKIAPYKCPSGYPISNLSTLIYLSKLNECDLNIFTGDLMHGSLYDTIIGANQLIFNSLNIDYWVPGNHEFGTIDKFELFDILVSPNYNSTMIISNIYIKPELLKDINKIDDPKVRKLIKLYNESRVDYVVHEVNNFINNNLFLKICIYGVSESSFISNLPQEGIFVLESIIENLNDVLEESRKDGCLDHSTLRILLSHSGLKLDHQILDEVKIDNLQIVFHAILGGHSHNIATDYPYRYKNTHLSHVGALGKWFGILKLQIFDLNDNNPFTRSDNDQSLRVKEKKKKELKNSLLDAETNEEEFILNNSFVWRIDQTKSSITSVCFSDSCLKKIKNNVPIDCLNNSHCYYNSKFLFSAPPNIIKLICEKDESLLQTSRNEILKNLSNTKNKIIGDWLWDVEDIYLCRIKTCKIGQFIALTMLIHLSNVENTSSIISLNNEDEPKGVYDAIIAVVIPGPLSGEFPSDSISIFENKLLKQDNLVIERESQITSFDIYRLFKFDNHFSMTYLKKIDELCAIISNSLSSYDNHYRSPALIHPAGFEYFVNLKNKNYWNYNTQQIEFVKKKLLRATFKVPLDSEFQFGNPNQFNFDLSELPRKQLWTLEDDQIIGILIQKLDGTTVRGYCDKFQKFHYYDDKQIKNNILVLADDYLLKSGNKIFPPDTKLYVLKGEEKKAIKYIVEENAKTALEIMQKIS